MRYNSIPVDKPETHQLVWCVNPQVREVLCYFEKFNLGFPIFIDNKKQLIKFHVKYWRVPSQEDHLLMSWSPNDLPAEVQPKRKYTKKPKK